jgi:hypothetical protein
MKMAKQKKAAGDLTSRWPSTDTHTLATPTQQLMYSAQNAADATKSGEQKLDFKNQDTLTSRLPVLHT